MDGLGEVDRQKTILHLSRVDPDGPRTVYPLLGSA